MLKICTRVTCEHFVSYSFCKAKKCPYKDEKKPTYKPTIADRVRQMTDEELAKLFTPYEWDGLPIVGCPINGEECGRYSGGCRECLLMWLRKEAEI